MPVSGKVTAINPRLRKEPTLVNSDAFGDGWMIQIEIADITELAKLMGATPYKALFSK